MARVSISNITPDMTCVIDIGEFGEATAKLRPGETCVREFPAHHQLGIGAYEGRKEDRQRYEINGREVVPESVVIWRFVDTGVALTSTEAERLCSQAHIRSAFLKQEEQSDV